MWTARLLGPALFFSIPSWAGATGCGTFTAAVQGSLETRIFLRSGRLTSAEEIIGLHALRIPYRGRLADLHRAVVRNKGTPVEVLAPHVGGNNDLRRFQPTFAFAFLQPTPRMVHPKVFLWNSNIVVDARSVRIAFDPEQTPAARVARFFGLRILMPMRGEPMLFHAEIPADFDDSIHFADEASRDSSILAAEPLFYAAP